MVTLLALAILVAVVTVFGFGPAGSGSHSPEVRKASSPLEPRLQALPRATTPPPEPAPPRMVRSVPTRLQIPAIRVDSTLMGLGLNNDGTMETPPGPFPAGWFTGAPTPGETGPAIIVGHVRYESPGVFERLTELRRKDEVNVQRKDGSTAKFRVTRVQHFAKSAFPSKLVYGNIDHAPAPDHLWRPGLGHEQVRRERRGLRRPRSG